MRSPSVLRRPGFGKSRAARYMILPKSFAGFSPGTDSQPVFVPIAVAQKQNARYDQRGGESRIKYGDKRLRQPAARPSQDTEQNHEAHHDPPLRIEKRKRAVPVAFPLDPLRMFVKQTFENQVEEQQEHDDRLPRPEQSVMGLTRPRDHSDPQNIRPGHDPDDPGRHEQRPPVDPELTGTFFHKRSLSGKFIK